MSGSGFYSCIAFHSPDSAIGERITLPNEQIC